MKGITGLVMSLLGGLIAISGLLMMLSLFERLIKDKTILILVNAIYLVLVGVAVFVLSKKVSDE